MKISEDQIAQMHTILNHLSKKSGVTGRVELASNQAKYWLDHLYGLLQADYQFIDETREFDTSTRTSSRTLG